MRLNQQFFQHNFFNPNYSYLQQQSLQQQSLQHQPIYPPLQNIQNNSVLTLNNNQNNEIGLTNEIPQPQKFNYGNFLNNKFVLTRKFLQNKNIFIDFRKLKMELNTI